MSENKRFIEEHINPLLQENDALREENERLREALKIARDNLDGAKSHLTLPQQLDAYFLLDVTCDLLEAALSLAGEVREG